MKLSNETLETLSSLFDLSEETLQELRTNALNSLRSKFSEEEVQAMIKQDEEIFERLNRIADERNKNVENT